MDMLSVVLHEHGHALGIAHSGDANTSSSRATDGCARRAT
ncbi:MAG: hypothetical protein JHC40_09075 [Burkholderiales bacterium]|nr:hypothetical protein [Burkholderiales bacterium]